MNSISVILIMFSVGVFYWAGYQMGYEAHKLDIEEGEHKKEEK